MSIEKRRKRHVDARTLFVRIVALVCAILIIGSVLFAAFL